MIAFVDLVPVATENIRKGQSYPVEYCLESLEEYSEGTIHKDEPESRNRNVNNVYFINQARANTRISRTEFIYDESMRLQNYGYLYLSFLLRMMFVKNVLLQIAFTPKHYKLM